MKRCAGILLAVGLAALGFGVGCASGAADPGADQAPTAKADPTDPSSPVDVDGTTVSGARPDTKSTTGLPSFATGDDDDDSTADAGPKSTSTGTTSDGGAADGGTSSSGGTSSGGTSSGGTSSGGTSGGTSSGGTSSGGTSSGGTSSGGTSSGGTSSGGTSSGGTVSACKATTSCSTGSGATDLGYVSGDTGADVVTATGSSSHWFKVIVGEDSSADLDLLMTATLTSPPGSNFDLFVYTQSCSSPTKYSTSTTGSDAAWITIPDLVGSDDQYVLIEVRAVSGSCATSAKWSLKVQGNK